MSHGEGGGVVVLKPARKKCHLLYEWLLRCKKMTFSIFSREVFFNYFEISSDLWFGNQGKENPTIKINLSKTSQIFTFIVHQLNVGNVNYLWSMSRI